MKVFMRMVNGSSIKELHAEIEKLRSALVDSERRVDERISSIYKEFVAGRESANKLVRLAYHDNLTGLPNRGLLMDRIKVACANAMRNKKFVAVFFIDLDGFKVINDTFGHEAGDDLLIWVGSELQQCVRANDTVARIGGDEFVAVITDLEDVESIGSVAKKIVERLGERVVIKGAPISIGASVGISIFPDDAEDPEALIREADSAMYEVKSEGKNGYKFFSQIGNKSVFFGADL